MPDIVINRPTRRNVSIEQPTTRAINITPSTGGGSGGVSLMPTVEISGNNLIFHYVTLAQMEKMHVDVAGTAAGTIGFVLTKGEENFELRFSDDSPQDFAGNLVVDDSIDIVDYIFELLIVEIISGYEVQWVRIDGVDANLLEADINWRLADIQKQSGEKYATMSEVAEMDAEILIPYE